MAYTSETQAVREMTPQEHLSQAAANLAGAADALAGAGSTVNNIRNELHLAEGELGRAQSAFADAVKTFQSLLDQYGLNMDVPMPDKRY